MASSKKKSEIRQAPKHLDKMLFINYREEGRLQQKLNDLTNNSRMRGIELDREKIQVHNEMRLNKRRNSSPAVIQVVSRPVTRPATQEVTRKSVSYGRRGSSSNDPVNEYLLTEFRRVSEVIPAILSSLTKDDKTDGEAVDSGGGDARGKDRKVVMAITGRSALSSLATPQLRLDPDLKAFASKEAGASVDNPNIGNIVSMIRSIKTLREDMAGKKRFEFTRAKTSFTDLLKNIHEEERKGSESDTYTDGACALLRRKISKARRASCPVNVMDPTSTQQGGQVAASSPVSSGAALPQRRLSRSNTSLASVNRHQSRDAEGMRAMLQEEDRQFTEIKVANEQRRYDDIRMRIGHFLHEVKGPQRRCSLPALCSTEELVEEEGEG